uniref:Uncharacterized protein n=1 Tax=Arundo donax TaxID=35708 RepID=A0A0A9HQ84_ARUDO
MLESHDVIYYQSSSWTVGSAAHKVITQKDHTQNVIC